MFGTTASRALLRRVRCENIRAIYTSTCHPNRGGQPFRLIQASTWRWRRPNLNPGISRSLATFDTTQTPIEKFRNIVRKARREHTILFPTLFIANFASLCFLALLAYDEHTTEGEDFGELAFSPALQKHLRTALWYTEIKPDVDIAANSFTKALKQAEREMLDPTSPEFAGIQIRFAAALEKLGRVKGAVGIMERLVDDFVRGIEDIDQGRTPTRRGPGTLQPNPDKGNGSLPTPVTVTASKPDDLERRRLLKRLIQLKHRISHLYKSDYIQDEVSAHRNIEEAMKLLIDSMADPRNLQFDENRADIDASEAAVLLSDAGSSHLTQGNHSTALEILKLALIAVRKSTRGRPSCAEAYILSNMQATVHAMLDSPKPIIDGKPATESSAKRARQICSAWAQQSLRCALAVVPTEEPTDFLCTLAVLSSYSGIAAAMVGHGDVQGARKMWDQVIEEAESHASYNILVPHAKAMLKDLDDMESKEKTVAA